MKFAIYGAGAVGSVLGARLAEAGHDVTLIARGAHLKALQTHGLKIQSKVFGDMERRLRAVEDPALVGPVDCVALALKAHSIGPAAERIGPLLGPDTIVLTLQNGIPWWYFYRGESGGDWQRIESSDPGGVIEKHIAAERVIGASTYCAARLAEPGVVEHISNLRFPMGEPRGGETPRLQRLSQAFELAGVGAPIVPEIRDEIWIKALGNTAFNPISSLTRATMQDMIEFPPTASLMREVMEETRAVARALGVEIPISTSERLENARRVGQHKTSMLQDLEAGRAPELEPMVGAVLELARLKQVSVPNIETVYACARLMFDVARGISRNGS